MDGRNEIENNDASGKKGEHEISRHLSHSVIVSNDDRRWLL